MRRFRNRVDGRNSAQGMKECSLFLELITKAPEIRLQDSKQVVEPDSQAVQISHGISTKIASRQYGGVCYVVHRVWDIGGTVVRGTRAVWADGTSGVEERYDDDVVPDAGGMVPATGRRGEGSTGLRHCCS